MALITLGLSHHNAPLDARERLAFTDSDLGEALARLRALPGVDEAAILSTCNRTELITVAAPDEEARLLEWWRRERQAPEGYIENFSTLTATPAALRTVCAWPRAWTRWWWESRRSSAR